MFLSVALLALAVRPGLPPQPVQPAAVKLGDGLSLLGWQADDFEVGRRGSLQITLFWYAQTRPAADYRLSLRLVDGQGQVLASKEKGPFFGAAPTSWWRAGEIVRDAQDLYLPPSVAPGDYYLEAGMFNPANGQYEACSQFPVPCSSAFGRLGKVHVGALPGAPHSAPAHPRQDNLGGQVRLFGFDLRGQGATAATDTESKAGKVYRLKPGERLQISLYWEPLVHLQEDYSVFVHLADPRGRNLTQIDSYPPHDLRYTAAWEPGRPLQDRYELVVPADATAGLYWLSAGLYRREDMQRLLLLDAAGRPAADRLVLAPVKVLGPPPPPPQRAQAADFAGQVSLLGYDLAGEGGITRVAPGERLRLRLFWRALAALEQDYTVFVHLSDAAGKVRAQQDNPPQGGTYATSLWDADEVVPDDYELAIGADVPPGEYRLQLGLYLPGSGERLRLAGSEESEVTLDQRVLIGVK